VPNRYHSSKALQLMKGYRIGRIAEPWVNFEPPIRGGTYRSYIEVNEFDPDDTDDTSDEWSSSLESRTSSTTSLESILDAGLYKSARTSGHSVKGLLSSTSSNTLSPKAARHRPSTSEVQHHGTVLPSPETYTSSAEQQEIDNDARDNPSLDAETQLEITKKYQVLHQRVKDEGFYDCHYIEYGKEMIRYSLLFATFITCLRTGWYMTSAAVLGLFWVYSHPSSRSWILLTDLQQQIMFTAHDAGHRGITHNFIADTLIGIFIADFCCGLSIGWWKSSHNVHHLITNDPVSLDIPASSCCANSIIRSMIQTFKTYLSSQPHHPSSAPSTHPTIISPIPLTPSPPSPSNTNAIPTTQSWPLHASTYTSYRGFTSCHADP
jgi:delta8-fatty-acid desaturase